MSNFHPLECVGRGSETQLQVCKNLNYLFLHFILKVETGFIILKENRSVNIPRRALVIEGNFFC